MFPLQFIEKNMPTHSVSKEERLELYSTSGLLWLVHQAVVRPKADFYSFSSPQHLHIVTTLTPALSVITHSIFHDMFCHQKVVHSVVHSLDF